MLDRNKTQLTHDVTQAAIKWLDERGFKPIETEVPVASSWVADIASFIYPTQTELIKLKMLPRRPRWSDKKALGEWNAEHRFFRQIGAMTCVVEVKTSRADFKCDKKFKRSMPATLCFLAIPKGMLKPDEWPVRWGILEYDGAVKMRQPSHLGVEVPRDKLDLIAALAIRRDHFTRYERWREYEKEHRVQRNADAARVRFSSCMRAVLDIAYGKHEDVESALRYYGIKTSLTAFEMNRLEALHQLMPKEERP